MEKPAVIFSEQGFKMFLEFVKGNVPAEEIDFMKAPIQEPVPQKEVDKFVSEYYKRPSGFDSSKATDIVVSLMSENRREWTSLELADALRENGFECDNRGITPIIRGIMNRDPRVVRVDKGVYQYVEA